MIPPASRDDDPFGPLDRAMMDAIRAHDAGLRALLCTLARHGLAMRRAQPARAQAWLDALAPHPYYKGGQFLFDLLEWEDFMLDGEAPPPLDAAAVVRALERIAQALRAVSAEIDGQPSGPSLQTVAPEAVEMLPVLAGDQYLFPCVVLGALVLLIQQPV
jgi:hypothetical protein